jgi:predicted nucleic acid-binding protein
LNNSRAVIDANIAIYALILSDQTKIAFGLLERLRQEKVSLYAPRLWVYEVTSGIHKFLHAKIIQPDVAEDAISAAFDLDINMLDDTPDLCQSASHWATRLNQMAVYDSFYLAVAESLDAHFWTADKRLANAAKGLGVDWVHWMGDLE